MSRRHEKLGVKQTIQKKWMDKTVQMMLAGLTETEIRSELDDYLASQKQSGGIGERGKKTYGMAIALLGAWFSPENELLEFRNDALYIASTMSNDDWIPLHWAILSASYPYWFNVAKQTGRLLNLQDRITQTQIFNRMKEQYGDRETVTRNARYTVRSFIGWGALKDSNRKGCYEKAVPIIITDVNLTILMVESALLAIPDGKCALGVALDNPGFFPFQLPVISGDYISNHCDRIDVVRYGINDDFLKLKGM